MSNLPPKTILECLRFAEGISKNFRNLENDLVTIKQIIARTTDVLAIYEIALKEIAKSDTYEGKLAKGSLNQVKLYE